MSKLTDHYQPYEFADPAEGPGCGVEDHTDDCLCDVDLSLVADDGVTRIGILHEAAAAVAGVPTDGVSLERWAAELLGLHGAMIERGVVTLNETAAEDIRSRFLLKHAHNRTVRGGGRYGYQAEVREFLRIGMSLTEIAQFVGVALGDVCDALNRSNIPPEQYVEAERLLRQGAQSYVVVSNQTGLSRHVVKRLADAMGVNTTTKVMQALGGGHKYTPEQYQRVLDLRDSGKTFTEISELTGLNRNACVGVVRRRKDKS